jgi:glycosyltransferase involved in cell wall biosynthesis
MPVYNAGEFLREAVNSVFDQSFHNFEIIAVDDGSTDNSYKILKELSKKDNRLKIYKNRKNLGVSKTANIAISKSIGQFLARLDADDYMPSDRLEKQVNFLRDNPFIVVVGGQVELVTKQGLPIVNKQFPLNHKEILKMAFEAMPIQQGAMMINKSKLPTNFKFYKDNLKTAEDLELLFRLFRYGQAANIPDTLLYYRQHGNSISQAECPKEIFKTTYKIRRRYYFQYMDKVGILPIVLSELEHLLVSVLPESLIYPIYYFWRGIKKPFQLKKYGLQPLIQHISTYLF